MFSWVLRLMLRSMVGALAASFMFVSPGVAQLSDQQLQSYEQQFLANPGQFLASNFTNGGSDLAAVIQALAADPANLQTVINALANANPSQQTAIGSGLGQAAAAAQQSNPTYANQIQTAVAASGSSQASAGYSSATGGTQIGSTGGGAGGGGGGGGGGPVGSGSGPPTGSGGGGPSGTGGTNQTGNSGQNLLTGGTVGGAGGVSGSVSP